MSYKRLFSVVRSHKSCRAHSTRARGSYFQIGTGEIFRESAGNCSSVERDPRVDSRRHRPNHSLPLSLSLSIYSVQRRSRDDMNVESLYTVCLDLIDFPRKALLFAVNLSTRLTALRDLSNSPNPLNEASRKVAHAHHARHDRTRIAFKALTQHCDNYALKTVLQSWTCEISAGPVQDKKK